MTAALLAQLAFVLACDAEAQIPDPYARPRKLATPAQEREAARLRRMSSEVFARADAAGYGQGGGGNGTDAAFGYLGKAYGLG